MRPVAAFFLFLSASSAILYTSTAAATASGSLAELCSKTAKPDLCVSSATPYTSAQPSLLNNSVLLDFLFNDLEVRTRAAIAKATNFLADPNTADHSPTPSDGITVESQLKSCKGNFEDALGVINETKAIVAAGKINDAGVKLNDAHYDECNSEFPSSFKNPVEADVDQLVDVTANIQGVITELQTEYQRAKAAIRAARHFAPPPTFATLAQACAKTPHPDLCVSKATPQAKPGSIDQKALLDILLDVCTNESQAMLAKADKLSATDPAMALSPHAVTPGFALNTCTANIKIGLENFKDSKSALNKHRNGLAKGLIGAAYSFLDTCNAAFKQLTNPVPNPLAEDITALQLTLENCYAIVRF